MFEDSYTVDCDTSLKKYPCNKYLNYHQLEPLAKKVFRQRTTHHASKSNSIPKGKQNYNKKSLMSTKTMSSTRARASSKQHNTIVSITPENCRAFTKEDIAGELNNYKELCLELRRENHSLKAKIEEKSRNYKEKLVDVQKRINKINEKTLEFKEKELKDERRKIRDQRSRETGKRGKGKESAQGSHRQLEGEFKRFFLHFLDHCGRVDEKVSKRTAQQKQMEGKLLLGSKLLKESCEYLVEKKYKFKSVYE